MDEDDDEQDHGHTSPMGAAQSSKLQLPATTDPPGPQNPPKPLVWVVSRLNLAVIAISAHF
jgi:hypothetical protein